MPNRWGTFWAAFVLLFAGCKSCEPGDDRISIQVRLVSDYAPLVEAAYVKTRIAWGEGEDSPFVGVDKRPLAATDELTRGLIVASFPNQIPGSYAVEMQLLRADESVIIGRMLRTRVESDTTITVYLTTECDGVICPNGLAANLTECLNGDCVDRQCNPDAVEYCDPEQTFCDSDEDCSGGNACASPVCFEGVCIVEPREGACATGEVCVHDRGCVPIYTPTDGGMDASTDANMDASLNEPDDAESLEEGVDIGVMDADELDADMSMMVVLDDMSTPQDMAIPEDLQGIDLQTFDMQDAADVGDATQDADEAIADAAHDAEEIIDAPLDADAVIADAALADAVIADASLADAALDARALEDGAVLLLPDAEEPQDAELIEDSFIDEDASLALADAMPPPEDAAELPDAALVADAGVVDAPPDAPTCVPGTEICNGVDDDCDDAIDEDGACVCNDGLDNDDDGETDDDDPGCTSFDDTSEYGTAQCDDGLDNDHDGRTDARLDSSGDLQCDSLTDTREATDIVLSPLGVGYEHNCVILPGGVKCWGDAILGYGENTHVGGAFTNSHGMMGDDLPYVDLGAGRTPRALALGHGHTCTLFDDGVVKCWGSNDYGQLGYGDASNRGDNPGEMAGVPAIDFGSGRSAVSIAAGGKHSCAALDTGEVACWGANLNGELGVGDTNYRWLPTIVDLGEHRAISVSSGYNHSCALFDDYSVKCWGSNYGGRLGLGDSDPRGVNSGEMGSALPLTFASSENIRSLSIGQFHSCAINSTGALRCWGGNWEGMLGLGDSNDRGDDAGEMANTTVSLGTGVTAAAVTAGDYISCAITNDGRVKCWGGNNVGQLGLGDTTSRGTSSNQMGDGLPYVNIGAGRTARAIGAGSAHVCVMMDDDHVRCWGNGPLGFTTIEMHGDNSNEMGEHLPSVLLVGTECSDGYDDDFDTFVDEDDPGCVDASDNNELLGTACDDGENNDGDSTMDMRDPGCSSPFDTSERGTLQCDDGIDNDNDSSIDQLDNGCANEWDDDEATNCNNGTQDWDELGVDCGGTCDACPSCSDGVQNGEETGVDSGPPCSPKRIELFYPYTVQAGSAQQLIVRLRNTADEYLDCIANPIVITTSDGAVTPPTTPLYRRYGGCVYSMALQTPPTQSITATSGSLTVTRSGIVVTTDGYGALPSITPINVPSPSHFTPIASANTMVDDYSIDGGFTIDDTIYFFASNGLGAKLYSYNPTDGVVQRSNTNTRGPDHQWVGGAAVLNGVLYFNAYTTEGCVKIFKYAPGDPMVTTPLFHTNDNACTALPTQRATRPSSMFGNGFSGELNDRGDDTPFASYFSPMTVNGYIYFAASNGTQMVVYEYDPDGTSEPLPIHDPQCDDGNGNMNPCRTSAHDTFLLGSQNGKIHFVGWGGELRYEHGDLAPQIVTDQVAVGVEIVHGINVGESTYYYGTDWASVSSYLKLMKYTIGDAAPVRISNVNADGADSILDLTMLGDFGLSFSALDADGNRAPYMLSMMDDAVLPIDGLCGAGCGLASHVVGALGSEVYFVGGDSDGFHFFKAVDGGDAVIPFQVNTVSNDWAYPLGSVGTTLYYAAYKGFLGDLWGFKYPSVQTEHGDGSFGYGEWCLYNIAAGDTSPTSLGCTASNDDRWKPRWLGAVGGSAYMDTLGVVFRHTPGDATVTLVTDAGVRMERGRHDGDEYAIVGDTLFFVGNTASPNSPRFHLFKHTPSDDEVQPGEALTMIDGSNGDDITWLTPVGNSLVFLSVDADGHQKLFAYTDGDPLITGTSALSNIVPGGDDGLFWNPLERHGGDSSVVTGNILLFTATIDDQRYAFAFDPSSPSIITASDALAFGPSAHPYAYIFEGDEGPEVRFAPADSSVIDGHVYLNRYSDPGGGLDYAPKQWFDGQAVEYFRIGGDLEDANGIGTLDLDVFEPMVAVEYVRLCDQYGAHSGAINGVFYFYAYVPGTDTCEYLATSPQDHMYPDYIVPFPGIGGASQTEYGSFGRPNDPLKFHSASGRLFTRGGVMRIDNPLNTHKLFSYEDGALTLLSTSVAGNDQASQAHVVGSDIYFAADACGGRVDMTYGGHAFSCRGLVRYTP